MLARRLDDAVNAAILAAQREPQHDLLPYHRAAVYAALAALETELGYWRRGRLAIATAAYVLPFRWQALPGDGRADALLRVTEQTLLGREYITTLEAARDDLWSWLEGRGVRPPTQVNGLGISENDALLIPFGGLDWERELLARAMPASALFAAEAALAAGIPVLGIDVFKGEPISKHDREADVLEPGQDAAWSAANAFAGRFEHADAERRLSFWMWWLTEAVPQACSSSPPDGWIRPEVQNWDQREVWTCGDGVAPSNQMRERSHLPQYSGCSRTTAR
jgi:hypothetical protein